MSQPPQTNLVRVLILSDPSQADRIATDLASIDGPGGEPLVGVTSPAQLDGPPSLVVVAAAEPLHPANLARELRILRDRWQPAPLLLLLPIRASVGDWALALPVEGLLQNESPSWLEEAVTTLLAGGRMVRLPAAPPEPMAPGLAQRLLSSGLKEIDAELSLCLAALEMPTMRGPMALVLRGRIRELHTARSLLLWLWGPLQLAYGSSPVGEEPTLGVAISLRQRSADAIWDAIHERLVAAACHGLENRSGRLLALDGLQRDRQTDLMLALLEQFRLLRQHLLEPEPGELSLVERWGRLQGSLRRAALQQLAGSYVQLPQGDELQSVADTLTARSEWITDDPEGPDPRGFLVPLLEARPVVVNGQLHAPDDPAAVLQVERLLGDWLVRSAELISGEVLACCSQWPELRRYLLEPQLLPTRNLERVRNRLNAQQRWREWFERPIQLYESRRPLFQVQDGAIQTVEITEPRDQELRDLPWPQQLVTLALEARDALAPQLQALLRQLGDLVVVVLTQVLGRAIGLVGRGIMQGMGRSVSRG